MKQETEFLGPGTVQLSSNCCSTFRTTNFISSQHIINNTSTQHKSIFIIAVKELQRVWLSWTNNTPQKICSTDWRWPENESMVHVAGTVTWPDSVPFWPCYPKLLPGFNMLSPCHSNLHRGSPFIIVGFLSMWWLLAQELKRMLCFNSWRC